MYLDITGLLIAVILQDVFWLSPVLAMSEDASELKCLRQFELTKGTEERLFKVVKCGEEHSVRLGCSPEMMDKIKDLPLLNSSIPENFDKFLESYKAMWKIMSDGLNYSQEGNGTFCWDMFAMEKTLKELEFLNGYFNWTSTYADMIVIAEVIFGLLANLLVLIIITKFKDMQTQPNMIILNLVVADTLQLLSFTAMSIALYLLPVTVVVTCLCNKLAYIVTFCCTCSVYSMVALSFLRYMAITAVPGSKSLQIMQNYVKIPLVIVVVWVTSSIASIPYMFDFSENCIPRFDLALQILGFTFFCLLPLLVVAVFSCATRRKLKKSIKEIPGRKGPRLECEIWARERGANMILALCIVFGSTFVPPTVGSLVSTITSFRYNNASYFHEILFLLNTCINPIALFITSSAFRKHFKLLLPNWVFKK